MFVMGRDLSNNKSQDLHVQNQNELEWNLLG